VPSPVEALLSKAHLMGHTDESGRRIRIFTAAITCDRTEKAGLNKFQYVGDTVPTGPGSDAKMSRLGGLPGRLRHGHGLINYDSGAQYVGKWAKDKRSGFGKFLYPCGDVYEGEWEHGRYHGEGKYYSPSERGDEYDGEWQHDKPHGVGRYLFRDSGTLYEGEWRSGMQEGKGREVSSNGEVWEGTWECGERISAALSNSSFTAGIDEAGQRIRMFTATLTCERATKANLASCTYDGETIPAEHSMATSAFTRMHLPGRVRHGYGKIRYECGNVYIGQWEHDKRSGVGTYWFACGDVYDGEWRMGMYHGKGVYTGSSNGGGGDYYDGLWEQDLPHGRGKYRYSASGDAYEGEFQHGRFHGEGTLTSANGEIKNGEWCKGLFVPLWQRTGQKRN